MELSAIKEAASEGCHTPPWTLCEDSLLSGDITGETSHHDLGRIRKELEQALESLAIEAIEVGCLNAKNVFDVLVDQHAIDGVLTKYLQARQPASKGLFDDFVNSGTKQMWREALRRLSDSSAASQFSNIKATGSFEGVSNEATRIASRDTVQPLKVGRYKKRVLEGSVSYLINDSCYSCISCLRTLYIHSGCFLYCAKAQPFCLLLMCLNFA